MEFDDAAYEAIREAAYLSRMPIKRYCQAVVAQAAAAKLALPVPVPASGSVPAPADELEGQQ
jgi:hypothetical protein